WIVLLYNVEQCRKRVVNGNVIFHYYNGLVCVCVCVCMCLCVCGCVCVYGCMGLCGTHATADVGEVEQICNLHVFTPKMLEQHKVYGGQVTQHIHWTGVTLK